jgi:hypothetical protein
MYVYWGFFLRVAPTGKIYNYAKNPCSCVLMF